MDKKYPEQGTEDKDQNLDPERSGARAAATDDKPRPAAEPPSTGDDRVDAAVAGLSRLPGRPADEHVAVLEEVHGRLRDILGELDEGPEGRHMAQGRP
jgi:hypothetical protein